MKDGINMQNTETNNQLLKRMILIALALGFLCTYLTIEWRVGIGMTLFILITCATLFVFFRDKQQIKNKKAFLWIVPIVLISLTFTLRANRIFSFYNVIVMWILFAVMFLDLQNKLNVQEGGFGFISRSFTRVFEPLNYSRLTAKMMSSAFLGSSKKSRIFRQIIIGLCICIPLVLVVLALLSSVDAIFSRLVEDFLEKLNLEFFIELFAKTVLAIVIAVYFFCQLYMLFVDKKQREKQATDNIKTIEAGTVKDAGIAKTVETKQLDVDQVAKSEAMHIEMLAASLKNGSLKEKQVVTSPLAKPLFIQKQEPQDLIIFLMVNCMLFIVYSVFAYIQVTYLFLETALPYGYTYSEYARRGFFELLVLTFINIAVMLTTIKVAKNRIYVTKVTGNSAIKIFMAGLCVLTVMLAGLSFYKMMLYYQEFGLTRLRVFVMIFLWFEIAGLVITLAFIFKPRLKIIAAYAVVGLAFYISINLINIDSIVAKSHVAIYNQTGDADFDYLASLSSDAYNEVADLKNKAEESEGIYWYSKYIYDNKITPIENEGYSWKSYSIPQYNAVQDFASLKSQI